MITQAEIAQAYRDGKDVTAIIHGRALLAALKDISDPS